MSENMKKGGLFDSASSEWDESKHPRDAEGKFTKKGEAERPSAMKKTPAEKIASVHIDPTRDNFLPELNEDNLADIGAKTNKPVLLKKSIIDRNAIFHSDISLEDMELIVANALYSPNNYVILANANKPYYNFIMEIEFNSREKPERGLVLLDVDANKENFEIVHVHFIRQRSYDTLKRKKTK